MENLTKFLLTLSAIASNNSNHAVNLITFRKRNSPGKAKPKENTGINDILSRATNQNAAVENGTCSRCKGSNKFHLSQVQTDGIVR